MSVNQTTMNLPQKLKHELRAVVLTTLYFALWFGLLVILKKLILAEYQIEFHGLSMVLIGALIVAKVVLVLEYIPLGTWTRQQPVWLDVVLRTVLYALGVLIVLLIEKAFEGRHEYGGFGPSLIQVFQHADIHHVWANMIGVTGALLLFNALSIIRRRFGKGELIRLFLAPPAHDHSRE